MMMMYEDFFFFQAEDGIRDLTVTGVQTCALPIYFADGADLWIEPWRARAFPIVKDLVVDRAAFDRIVQAGGFITARTGSAPEANSIPDRKSGVEGKRGELGGRRIIKKKKKIT